MSLIWYYPASDGETSILELWVMQITASLRLIPAIIWLGVVVPVWVPFMSQAEHFTHLTECKQINDIELFELQGSTWNLVTVCNQMSSGLFKMLPKNYSFKHVYQIFITCKLDLAINNLQSLICHKLINSWATT